MAGNIYGYQGVHTPLESVTQGRYTLADYTSMRTELTSRLIALENQGGFVPTNVEITGYLHMLPGGAGMGEIETTSSITGESLYINSLAQCGSIECNGNLTIGGTVSANGVALSGNVSVAGTLTTHDISIVGGSTISGDGSGLFNVNDNTKLPLLGGTLVGPLSLNSNPITAISTTRTGLLTIGTQSNVLGQNTTAFNQSSNFTEYISYATSGSHRWFSNTAANAQVQSLSMSATAITTPCSITAASFSGSGAALTSIPYSALTGTVPTWNQNTTGNALTATTVGSLSGGSAGVVPYQSGPGSTLFTAVGTAGQVLTSQGTGAPIWSSASSAAPTVITVNGVSGVPTGYTITNTALEVIYRLNQYALVFDFQNVVIGQVIIFARSAFDATNNTLTYSNFPTLKFRVYALNGNVTNISSFGQTFALTYTYAGQQKIRSTFLVAATTDLNYSFDLIEIA